VTSQVRLDLLGEQLLAAVVRDMAACLMAAANLEQFWHLAGA
jgi:hypothetical protein